MKEFKFRAWSGNKMFYSFTMFNGSVWDSIQDKPIDWQIMQFTGLKDKNGKDIYSGDILRFRKPIRTTQTHTGDNIPNGSYTEPMEPEIETHIGEVKFENGCFVFDDFDNNEEPCPLFWDIQEWDEESIKQAISYGRPNRFIWDDSEEGDMQYLLQENKLTELNQLIEYLSGVEIIGNIHENPEILTK